MILFFKLQKIMTSMLHKNKWKIGVGLPNAKKDTNMETEFPLH